MDEHCLNAPLRHKDVTVREIIEVMPKQMQNRPRIQQTRSVRSCGTASVA
jgi:hypothetical protein